MSIDMDPQGVQAAGDDLAVLASSRAGRSLDSSKAAASAHGGWASSAAVDDCRQVWERHLADLVGQVEAAARKLRASASLTRQADAEGERRLRQVLDEWSG